MRFVQALSASLSCVGTKEKRRSSVFNGLFINVCGFGPNKVVRLIPELFVLR